jgi:hypothetical protein
MLHDAAFAGALAAALVKIHSYVELDMDGSFGGRRRWPTQ